MASGTKVSRIIFGRSRLRWNSSSRAASTSVIPRLEKELEAIKAAGTWKTERVITTPQDVSIKVQGNNQSILNFCANNYLGLSSHPDVVGAAVTALKTHGSGLSSVRFICGTQDIHTDLESKIARFHGREDAILYASCFDANAGLFEQLLGPEDAVFSDELNHASIIDGIRLCKAKKHRYKHKDMNELESQLKANMDARTRLIATDGVFSMDGNVAPLPKIVELAERYDALVFVDECHATGFFGAGGRGTENFFPGISGKVDIINSTLGKALGGAAGGYTTAKKEICTLLRQRSRPYLFSNSLPPPVVAAAAKVFDMITDDDKFYKKISGNTKRFRDGMTKAGFEIGGEGHPICPVMLYEEKLAIDFAAAMLERGIYVIGFTFPVVPRGKARIRVQISAAHTEQDIDRTTQAFTEVGKDLKVI